MERIRVLGTMAVSADGAVWRAVSSRRRRAVLGVLAARANHLVSVDRLLDEVWAGAPPPTATTALQAHVAGLRDALEPDRARRSSGSFLFSETDGYVLRVDPGELDVLGAEDAISRGVALRREDRADHAAASFAEALGRLRDEPYPGVETLLVDDERRRLVERRSLIVEELAAVELTAGRLPEVIARMRAVLADEPCRERAAGLLVIALARAGRPREALEVYESTRRHLAEDLGLEPTEELRELHRAVLARDARVMPPPDPPRATVSSSPTGDRPLVGRDDLLGEIDHGLDTERLVSLVGPPGVGTTRLAREIAARSGSDVRWLDLGESAGHVLEVLGDVLGARPAPNEHLADALARRAASLGGVLVVVDGVDPVIEELAEVLGSVLVPGGPTVLTTGHRPVGRGGERIVPVPALRPSAATELLLEAAEAARPGCTTHIDHMVVKALAEHLDGLPLALELAGARLWSLGAEELLSRIDDRFELLGNGLAASVAVALEQLDDGERRALGRLAVLPGRFDLGLVDAVVGHAGPDLVASLAERSLVEVDHDEADPYRLLSTVRLAAIEGLDRTELADAEEAHTRWLLDRIGAGGGRYAGAIGDLELGGFRHLTGHIHTVADRLLADGDPRVIRLGAALRFHFLLSGRLDEGRRLLGRACGLPGGDADARAAALAGGALLAWWQGDYAEVQRSASAAVELGAEDASAVDLLRGSLAWVRGDLLTAAAHLDAALRAARERDLGWERAMAAAMAANASWFVGDIVGAASRYREAAIVGRRLGDRWTAGLGLRGHAYMAALDGDLVTAERLLARDAASLAESDVVGRGQAAAFGGLVALVSGDRPTAMRQLTEAVTVGIRTGDIMCLLLGVCGAVELLAPADPVAGATVLGWLDAARELGGPPLPPREQAAVDLARSHLEAALDRATLTSSLTCGATMTPRELADLLAGSCGDVPPR